MASRSAVRASRSDPWVQSQCLMVQMPTINNGAEAQIADDILEQYSLDKLDTSLVPAVERHVLACPVCRDRLKAIEPVSFVHVTKDGPVYSRATKLATGRVMARRWGKQMEGIRECVSVAVAKLFLTQSFFQMFPEHRCGSKCSPAQDRGVRY